MNIYKISVLFICVNGFDLNSNWDKFLSTGETNIKKEIFKLSVLEGERINKDIDYIDIEDKIMRMLISGGHILLVNNDYSQAYLLRQNQTKTDIFLCYLFNTHAIQHHMIQFHSSLIEHEDRGLMFLGPSGIGKTTQAELWNKYRNALIINGDIVFVQETEDGFLGWGTPWHGSSPYCENTSVPVKALVVLKQAPENSIRELTGFEKVTAVSNSVFYPRWLENGMELCLETLDHLLSALPVYELSCRPDEEAVQLTEEAVFGRG